MLSEDLLRVYCKENLVGCKVRKSISLVVKLPHEFLGRISRSPRKNQIPVLEEVPL
jgi:hypothetical protein